MLAEEVLDGLRNELLLRQDVVVKLCVVPLGDGCNTHTHTTSGAQITVHPITAAEISAGQTGQAWLVQFSSKILFFKNKLLFLNEEAAEHFKQPGSGQPDGERDEDFLFLFLPISLFSLTKQRNSPPGISSLHFLRTS